MSLWIWVRAVARRQKPDLELVVDVEGVVRVIHLEGDTITVTARELGQLLTALLKAVITEHPEQDETVEVNLN